MQVVIPPGAFPGQNIQVASPNGLLTVMVPENTMPGQTMIIQVPQQAMVQAVAQPIPHAQSVTPQPVASPQKNSSQYASAPVPQLQVMQRQQHSVPMPTAPMAASTGGAQQALLSGHEPATPMGVPVAEVMPKAMPMAHVQAHQQYVSYAQYSTEHPDEAGRHHAHPFDGHYADATASADVPIGQPVFYNDAEVATLMAAPVPADPFKQAAVAAAQGVPAGQMSPPQGMIQMDQYYTVANDARGVVSQPMITTAAGMPIINTAAQISSAETHFDGWTGIKSCDPVLQSNPAELLLFFNTHNSRPYVGCNVHGWHMETRHRTVERRDGDRVYQERETYYVKVDDFQYKIDLTAFIFPYGYITSVDENNLSVPELVDKYLGDNNKLKSLEMKKQVINFDFGMLHAMVYGYIRSLGWRRGLTISFPKANHTVRIYNENCLSNIWENSCCYCLCHVTIVPCIIVRCYRGDCCCSGGGSAESDIRSYFQIQYHPAQVFEAIRQQLWCPGWSGAEVAMELFRDIFW